MIFKEKKTPTLLMMPLANGWRAVHKKYKNEYGTVICTEKGDTVEVVTDFGEFSTERTEAVESAAAMIFENNGVKEITVDGEKLTREAWQEKEDARLNALHRTREDYKNVLGKPVHCVTDRPLGSAHPRYPEMIYPVNYGYVPGVMAGDNAEQDVYILGPTEPLKAFDGVVIFYTHGHMYGVKYDLDTLADAASARGAEVALFGHTHIPHAETRGGVFLFNPGSCGRCYTGPDTYGILTLDEGKVTAYEHKEVPKQ